MPVPVPPAAATATFTRPGAWAPVVPMIVVAFTTFNAVTATPPIVTPVTPVKFVPVMVTGVPPACGPIAGTTFVTVGAAMYVKREFAGLVPLGVVTTTLRAPAVPAGVVQMRLVAVMELKPVAAAPPMVTPVAPVRFVPLIVTTVPPAAGPLPGEMPVTVGAAASPVPVTLISKGFSSASLLAMRTTAERVPVAVGFRVMSMVRSPPGAGAMMPAVPGQE